MEYEWRNFETGELRSTRKYNEPPDDSGNWQRVYSFGVGSVKGAGSTPGRTSTGYRVRS
jgi:hypothetical protein